ncbi:MAG: malate dehydrogenase [Marine Group II euryarchaeote MED-G38]|nr:malate dehydrogenase [Euryarchaeota archaeon]OUV26051.1 MAG: malate dehydrogenase [Euryarchaeota archaeon TMED97]PDH23034.1 MAG: malate dehydrogenase [Marine Group II euryarchaeote MED-G38]|tara:strand:- start:1134 stop:2072 length:939 start_codon:yes stop_codon:yes gene_type:complete
MARGSRKVAIIGAGNVGATCAFVLAERKIGEIVLLDIFEGFAKGKALDMSQGGKILNYDGKIIGTKDYADIAGSEVVIVTSGFPRQPGMSREDLIGKNAEIVSQVGEGIKKYAPESIIIMVTNPLDLMTYHMQKVTGFSHKKVIGQAGILDSARMTHFVADALGCSNEDVQAMVLGGHGDTMVPLPRYTTVGGIPITQLLSREEIEAISTRTANGGGEIVKLLERGSAFYAPGSAAAIMAESVLNDRRRLLPCSAYLNGEYGMEDVYIGVPIILGKNGVEEIIQLDLKEIEINKLQNSGSFYKEQLQSILQY